MMQKRSNNKKWAILGSWSGCSISQTVSAGSPHCKSPVIVNPSFRQRGQHAGWQAPKNHQISLARRASLMPIAYFVANFLDAICLQMQRRVCFRCTRQRLMYTLNALRIIFSVLHELCLVLKLLSTNYYALLITLPAVFLQLRALIC